MSAVRRGGVLGLAVTVGLGLAACGSGGDGAGEESEVLRIATVDNPDMRRMADLVDDFTADHPGLQVEFEFLGEGELRQRVTTDLATGAGQGGGGQYSDVDLEGTGRYDVITVGTYEVSMWAEQGWLRPVDDAVADPEDLIPAIREALTHDGSLHAVPFYGESSFTMYRTDLFEQAGLEMPQEPTWEFILEAAEQLHNPAAGVNGACVRGRPGWGENTALVTAMAVSHGGRWFDEDWAPQLDTQPWTDALTTYVELGAVADPDSPGLGYTDNLERFAAGQCAIWVDSTAAGSLLSDPDTSQVAESVGYAMAPGTGLDRGSNWLWAWSLAVAANSDQAEAAHEFVQWATAQEFTELVAAQDGWGSVPPGTRLSLYESQDYLDAAPYAEVVLQSLETADPQDPTVEPVPYSGIQYVAVPEFQSLGSAAGNQFAQALAGERTVAEALENSQWVTERISERIRFAQEDTP